MLASHQPQTIFIVDFFDHPWLSSCFNDNDVKSLVKETVAKLEKAANLETYLNFRRNSNSKYEKIRAPALESAYSLVNSYYKQ